MVTTKAQRSAAAVKAARTRKRNVKLKAEVAASAAKRKQSAAAKKRADVTVAPEKRSVSKRSVSKKKTASKKHLLRRK